MSTFSPNLNFEEVARGGDVGTWDTPTNSNWSISDLALGAITTIGLNNSNVILSAAQFQSKMLTFNSTLTGSVNITFPTSFTKSYEIQNLCSGSSAFTITLQTTAGAQAICCPPGEIVDVVNDGANLKFKNLGRVGTCIDFAFGGSPNWIVGCTVQPYLPCTGVSFSSATYPVLATMLGQTTTPDRRGTVAANLDQGAGRLTNISALFAVGGDQNLQSHTHTMGTESAAHTHSINGGANFAVGNAGGTAVGGGALNVVTGETVISGVTTTESANHTHTNANTGSGSGQNLPPTTIIGITWIRAG